MTVDFVGEAEMKRQIEPRPTSTPLRLSIYLIDDDGLVDFREQICVCA